MKGQKIMIVAGGEWQVPIIKKAKQLGLRVMNTNLYQDSPGFQYADESAVADVLDYKTNLQIAEAYKPNAIITDQSDIAVKTVARLCERLKLKGITEKIADLFTNKYLMRMFCKEHGFDIPRFELCCSLQEAETASEKIGYPLVMKPLRNQSSRGVFVVYNKAELFQKFNLTLQFSESGEVLVEEFIDGKEFTVEGFMFSDRHISLAVSAKDYLKDNIAIATRLVYSHENFDFNYDCLKIQNNNLVETMKLPFGITHAEYKYKEGRFYLIEIAARGGGTKISSDIVPLVSGVDVNELLIRSALGEEIKSGDISLMQKSVAILDFFILPTGRVKSIIGAEEITMIPGVVDFKLNFKAGDTISTPNDDRSRVGYYIAHASYKESLLSLAEYIKLKLKVIYDE
ncbi:hypothetical protein J40TS1_47490 [Paenibacillus montaniterrae]|uniref:ATP-grasp domain-containing protein n=1 Tax=Paenibacillus montaniterrae TaxID=429341 RepID=A0A919YTX2_9BACL|nr:ATP-grasp domain-containing protein [Paenibacillus montaniterrae]GIP19107.1 hypothetical protein J40TS1_47490 [Paenibacillus montaniterrae]